MKLYNVKESIVTNRCSILIIYVTFYVKYMLSEEVDITADLIVGFKCLKYTLYSCTLYIYNIYLYNLLRERKGPCYLISM